MIGSARTGCPRDGVRPRRPTDYRQRESAVPRKPWFPFFVDDFWQDESVQAMTLEEVGLYLRLLCFQWREGSIPGDLDRLAKIVGVESPALARLWENVGPCFDIVDGGLERLANPRLVAIQEKAEATHQRLSTQGRKGGTAIRKSASPAKARLKPGSTPAKAKVESESEVTTEPPRPPAEGTERAGESINSQDGTAATGSVSGSSKTKSGGSKRKKPTTPPPASFTPSTSNQEWFRSSFGVVAKSLVDRETEKFLDRHRSKGNQFVDWQAAWRTWMTNWQTDFGKSSPAGVPDRPERPNPNLVTGEDESDG